MTISMYWNEHPKKPTDRQRKIIEELRGAIGSKDRPPILAVPRIIREIIDKQVLNADAQEYLEAIRVAIQDEDSLAVDESRESRSDIQIYFQELEQILAKRLSR